MELKSNSCTSILYHDIFDYKLTKEELVKWQYKDSLETTKGKKNKSRLQREKYSKEKFKIAKKTAKLISKIPTVKFVGITGALAMNNAGENSDIDLMIITKGNYLWTTRLLCLFLLFNKIRRFGDKNEKNRLCLNMWLDQNDLVWNKKDRNVYTAHEIAQVVTLVNKDRTYEKFLYLNRWILDYWPNAVKISLLKIKNVYKKTNIFEKMAFKLQYLYMQPKITREVVTPTRAIFHPNDWGKKVSFHLSTVKQPYLIVLSIPW